MKKFLKITIFSLVGLFLALLILWFAFPNSSALKEKNPKVTALMKWREKEALKNGKKAKASFAWKSISR